MNKFITYNNIQIPFLGIGTDSQNCAICVDAAIKKGFRFFDTAYMYSTETSLGKVIFSYINDNVVLRSDFFIQTKTPHTKPGYSSTLLEFNNSLNKLQIDYLDSYLIHFPCRDKENWRELTLDTWMAMEKLYKEGKVKVIGVSNFLPHHLDFLIKNSEVKPMINQIEIHPQHSQDHTIEFCKNNNILVQAWSPFGAGRVFYNKIIKDVANNYHTTITNFILNWHLKNDFIPIVGINSDIELEEISNYKEIDILPADLQKVTLQKDDFTNCHNDANLIDWIPVIPYEKKSSPISALETSVNRFYLFGILPFFKVKKITEFKSKYYLFNILIAKSVKSISIGKANWRKSDYRSGKYIIEPVFNDKNIFLESPVWDRINNLLYCIAEYHNKIYRINPKSNKIETYLTKDGIIGAIDVDFEGNLIIAEDSGIYRLNFDTKMSEFLVQLKPEINGNFPQAKVHYNDGKLDARGRFVVGTASKYNNNKLYSFDGHSVKVIENNITCSNGIAWSLDSSWMYYTDSITKKIGRYFYNLETGNTIFDKYVIEFATGLPDGMCIDIDDNLWVADFIGKRVCKYNTKDFSLIDEIFFPVHVTSCCIGGENLEYLYVTTAQPDNIKISSGLFRIKIR